jgi:ribosome-associated protein
LHYICNYKDIVKITEVTEKKSNTSAKIAEKPAKKSTVKKTKSVAAKKKSTATGKEKDEKAEKTVKAATSKEKNGKTATKKAATKDTIAKSATKGLKKTPAKSAPAKSKKKELEEVTRKEIETIVEAALDKKAKNVCSLDLKNIGTSICDYFVICNADSTPNVLAIADNIEDQMIIKCKRKLLRMQGKENAFWIILDYSDIVVHIFQTEYREFYRLEDLWADAKITKYED